MGGARPSLAKARDIPGLDATIRFRDAAASAVLVRSEEVFGFAGGVLDTGDIERVHDMRVATRRLRAVMEIFAPCFPRAEHKRALREVKDLADALGQRRDPDVAIAALEQVKAGLRPADRPGIKSLIDELHAEQAHGNELLAAALTSVDESGLRERLLGLAEAARSG